MTTGYNSPTIYPDEMGVRGFVREYAPDFCWCTMMDLFIMMEQIPHLEDIEHATFKQSVHYLRKKGWFDCKKIEHSSAYLYIRIRK